MPIADVTAYRTYLFGNTVPIIGVDIRCAINVVSLNEFPIVRWKVACIRIASLSIEIGVQRYSIHKLFGPMVG